MPFGDRLKSVTPISVSRESICCLSAETDMKSRSDALVMLPHFATCMNDFNC